MDPVQEMIDEHKHEIPIALAKKLLDACKAEAEANESVEAMFRRVFAEGGLEGEALERRVRERLADVFGGCFETPIGLGSQMFD
eukprot:4704224-Prymnesium_polylepis.1